jgi:hypothetical protein
MKYERFGETELMGDPRAQQSANEPEGNGDQQTAPASARQCPADGSADRCDHDENDEAGDCQCHHFTFIQMSFEPNISNNLIPILDGTARNRVFRSAHRTSVLL